MASLLSADSQRGWSQPAPLEGTRPLSGHTLLLLVRLDFRQMKPAVWVLLWVMFCGSVYAMSQAVGVGLPWWAVLLVAGCVAVPFVAAARVGTLSQWRLRGWLVGYFDDNSSLLVHRDRDGHWLISDHMTIRPHQGSARQFRRRVFDHLARQADRHQAVIVTDTSSEKLANLYAADMLGLVRVGTRRDWLGRSIHLLRRDPVPTPVKH